MSTVNFNHPMNEIVYNNILPNIIDQNKASIISKAIKGYTKREGFKDSLKGLIYRIWNVVKAIFGQSDWQRANRVIINETKAIKAALIKYMPDTQKPLFMTLLEQYASDKKIVSETKELLKAAITFENTFNPSSLSAEELEELESDKEQGEQYALFAKMLKVNELLQDFKNGELVEEFLALLPLVRNLTRNQELEYNDIRDFLTEHGVTFAKYVNIDVVEEVLKDIPLLKGIKFRDFITDIKNGSEIELVSFVPLFEKMINGKKLRSDEFYELLLIFIEDYIDFEKVVSEVADIFELDSLIPAETLKQKLSSLDEGSEILDHFLDFIYKESASAGEFVKAFLTPPASEDAA